MFLIENGSHFVHVDYAELLSNPLRIYLKTIE